MERLTVSGGTKLAKAVSYAKSEKKNLYRYLESGEIPIDNNRVENVARPFCVGKKLVVLSFNEGSRIQYDDVLHCGCGLCECDERGGVSYRAVPV